MCVGYFFLIFNADKKNERKDILVFDSFGNYLNDHEETSVICQDFHTFPSCASFSSSSSFPKVPVLFFVGVEELIDQERLFFFDFIFPFFVLFFQSLLILIIIVMKMK